MFGLFFLFLFLVQLLFVWLVLFLLVAGDVCCLVGLGFFWGVGFCLLVVC